jgi:hypothetical protein
MPDADETPAPVSAVMDRAAARAAATRSRSLPTRVSLFLESGNQGDAVVVSVFLKPGGGRFANRTCWTPSARRFQTSSP